MNETALAIELAEAGGGITYCQETLVTPVVEAGRLVEVLQDWASASSGFHIYYPSRRQVPQALKALIPHLRAAYPS